MKKNNPQYTAGAEAIATLAKPKSPNPVHYITLKKDADQALHDLVDWLQAQSPDQRITKSKAVSAAVEVTYGMVKRDFYYIPLGPEGEILTLKSCDSRAVYAAIVDFGQTCKKLPDRIPPKALQHLFTGDGTARMLCLAIVELRKLVENNPKGAEKFIRDLMAKEKPQPANQLDFGPGREQ